MNEINKPANSMSRPRISRSKVSNHLKSLNKHLECPRNSKHSNRPKMVAPATPSTPSAQTVQQPTPTGSWRHPQYNEITKRQYATTCDETNIRIVLWNGAYLIGTYICLPFMSSWPLIGSLLFVCPSKLALLQLLIKITRRPVFQTMQSWPQTTFWLSLSVRLIFLYNIAVACLPILRRYLRKDEIADIPLTPSQRAAMGLDPSVKTPATPGSAFASPNYVTPPRYARSTPRTSFSGSERKSSESPLSGSPLGMGKSTSNSPFSPGATAQSPLFQKALGGGSADRRRSFSRQSPLSANLFGDSSASTTPGTPTPAPAKASVGLNNRWLYEKGRGSPGRGLFA